MRAFTAEKRAKRNAQRVKRFAWNKEHNKALVASQYERKAETRRNMSTKDKKKSDMYKQVRNIAQRKYRAMKRKEANK